MSVWTVPSYAEEWAVPGYAEGRELGRGASGRVVAATNLATGQRVAIKYLSPSLARDPDFLADFRQDVEVLRALDVPQIVRLLDFVEEPGRGAAIVMELVDGVSLREMISRSGPVTPESALVVLKDTLLGMAAAHRFRVGHRDYKPENVLVDARGRSKLSDFGVVVSEDKRVPAGTPLYMAPELWDWAPVTPASDIYAATAVFFECLTGKPPFSGRLGQLREEHESAPVPLDEVDGPLQDLIARGMAKNPAHRPRAAIALVAELDAVAAASYGPDWERQGRRRLGERAAALLPVVAAATGASAAVNRRDRRTIRTAAIIAVGALVALAIVAGAALKLMSSNTPANVAASIKPTFTAQITVTPPVVASRCATASAFAYSGMLTASAPGTVSYRWVYSSGKPGPVETASFTAAGTQQVTGEIVRTAKAGAGWAEIKMVSPAGTTSNKATYKLLCNKSTAGQIITTASVQPKAKHVTCGTKPPAFTATGTITSRKAGTVTYYWALSDGQNSAPATLTFTAPGTKAVAPLTITPPGDPATGEAVLVVTSPAAATSSPATYTLSCKAAPRSSTSSPSPSAPPTAVATVSPARKTVACTAAPPTFTFSGTIAVGKAGPVSYYWKLPSGNGPIKTLQFAQAGTQAVAAATYTPGTDRYSGTGSIVVTSPSSAASNGAAFTLACSSGGKTYLPLTITPDAPATATVGQTYSASATVTGGDGTYTWSGPTGLPAGLTYSTAAGTLTVTGTPTVAGTFTVGLFVRDGEATPLNAQGSFTVTVSAAVVPLSIDGGTLAVATVGDAYAATVTATGGTGAYTWSATGLPPGLSIDPPSGTISGTPTAAGIFTPRVTVTDSAATPQTASATFSLTVNMAVVPLSISGTLTAGTEGVAYTATLTASGGTAPYTWSATGLPAGLLIDPATGTVSGIPIAAGSFPVDVTVTDSSAVPLSFSAPFTLVVAPAPVESSTSASPSGPGPGPGPGPASTAPTK
jgi:eukaryotic-like serine/threonine-protein kinase